MWCKLMAKWRRENAISSGISKEIKTIEPNVNIDSIGAAYFYCAHQ